MPLDKLVTRRSQAVVRGNQFLLLGLPARQHARGQISLRDRQGVFSSATVVPEYLGLKRIPALVHYVSARLLVFFAPEPCKLMLRGNICP